MNARLDERADDLLRIPRHGFEEDPRAALAARLGDPPVVDASQIAAVPVVLERAYLEQLRSLNRVLDGALRGIVARYFDDARIRAIYALPAPLEALLRLAHDRPYQVGFHRPDFVYDRDGQPRICEIGARYPLNGWMLSRAATETYARHAVRMGLAVQDDQPGFIDDLCARYRPGECVAMVHAREAGTEIFLLAQALRERGIAFVQAHPSQLGVRDGRLVADGVAIDACILEMDRTELPLIPPDALAHMIASGAYFNDVRTLVLVHDKRTLAVLWDEAIMRDILSAAGYAVLRAFLIPSWVIAEPAGCDELLARSEDMIAKRSSGGRGIDALVRSECGETAWEARVRTEWASDMYQEYVPQRDFRAPGEALPIHLVGMQLCRDARSYGAGVFRGSDAKVINVHGARGRIYVPTVTR